MAKQSIHPLKRIDINLAEEITKFSKKNDISFRQASQEVAKLIKIKVANRKILKEIRI